VTAQGPVVSTLYRARRSRAETRAEAAPALLDEQEWRRDGALTRTRTALGQSLRTKLAGDGGTEQMGTVVRQLDAAAIATARRELRRHPLALLAAHVRGELVFRTVTTGEAGDRRLAVLETNDGGFERLRMHIDVESGLVRAVESWEATALDDCDIRGSTPGVHRDSQDDRSLLAGLAGFDRVNEGGSFGEGCLRCIPIWRTASDRAGRLGAGIGFTGRRGGGFLGFWSRRFWRGTLRCGSWLGFRQNLGLFLQGGRFFGERCWHWCGLLDWLRRRCWSFLGKSFQMQTCLWAM
jgi:hypothetical protein